MVAHLQIHRFKRADPLPTPSAIGISDAITAVPGAATAASLAFDVSVSSEKQQTAPPLAISTDLTVTISPTITGGTTDGTPSSLSPTMVPSAAANTSASISMSTVVASCVGAFIGATALIGLALWFYKRYLGSLKQRAQPRRAFPGRNHGADAERRRSHLEPWNKLDDNDDKWEGMYHPQEVENVAPMEKLTMFKKTPSVRTAWTHKSEDAPVFDPQSFAQYHPSIAESIASKKGATAPTEDATLVMPRRADTSGSVSSSPDMAIPTPVVVESQLHRWESAEVLEYHPTSFTQEPEQNPFEDDTERRKSLSNPFFNSLGHQPSRSRSNSKATIIPSPNFDKGKGRSIDEEPEPEHLENPFGDEYRAANLPQPPFSTNVNKHTNSDSQSSVSSQDRALQSLIAALDIPEAEIQERLRVASMQPSVMSAMSDYTFASTADEEDLAVTRSFPLPPSTPTTPSLSITPRGTTR